MTNRLPILTLASLIIAVPAMAAEPATAARGDVLAVQESAGDVRFVTGGIGSTEREAMSERFGDWPLKIVNAQRDDSAYVSGVAVTLRDADGATVLETTTEGPWLFADLQPGRYAIEARFDDQTVERSITVDDGGQQRTVMTWTGDKPSS
ncbi:carboxypeptidase regulatory-like domain-containing protein [Algiphilus sp.]|uniref:carboxypeptidase regulatory-like domain-containing protein n=1 Tax=Algiphilus sp. TaxID=1872431 RepID=UPI003C527382